MKLPSRKVSSLVLVVLFIAIFAAGCGETVRGLGRDASRVGRGVKTIFISD